MPEMNFDAPEDGEETPLEDQEQEQEEPEQEPEPEPEQEQEPDRLSKLENAVSELVEWARGSQEQRTASEPVAKKPPKPNFGPNTVASALWDRIEAMEARFEEPWKKLEEQKRQDAAVEAEFTRLKDMTAQHIAAREAEGDPKVDARQVMDVLVKTGILTNRRVPYTEALDYAYNAVAYRAAKEAARKQGHSDVRRPDAKLPAPYRPGQQQRPAPAHRKPANANPYSLDQRTARLKKEFAEVEQQLSGKSPEELEDSLGFNQ